MGTPDPQLRAPAEDSFDGAASSAFFRMGTGSVGRPHVRVYKGDRHRVTVGCYVAIEPDVDFHVGGNHRLDWVTTYGLREMFSLPGAFHNGNPWSNGDIIVGNGASIGRGTKVMSGITIGDGAVVAPFSVVTRDVMPYSIVVGCPACSVGRRFADGIIEHLRQIDWCNWPAERIGLEVERLTGVAANDVVPALAGDLASQSATSHEARAGRAPRAAKARRVTARLLRALARRMDTGRADGPAESADRHAGGVVTLGRASYFLPIVHVGRNKRARVTIGNYSSVSEVCEILLDQRDAQREPSHGLVASSSSDRPLTRPGDVTIGSDTWIATGAKIFPGVTIGDGAVVAAWSVVTDDVAPYTIVAGNPARQIGRRFDEETAEALLRIRWWDWPEDRVLACWRELCGGDVASFVEQHDPRSADRSR